MKRFEIEEIWHSLVQVLYMVSSNHSQGYKLVGWS
jgi:hypothetical protein